MVLNEAAQRLGVSLRQTEDELTRNMLKATAAFINCTGGTNSDSPTEMTRSDVDEIIRTLVNNDAYTIADNIEGEDRFGTAPVRDAFFAMANSQLIGDLENVQGFIAKAQYPSPMHALNTLGASKFPLIDLEVYGESYDDRAQAEPLLAWAA